MRKPGRAETGAGVGVGVGVRVGVGPFARRPCVFAPTEALFSMSGSKLVLLGGLTLSILFTGCSSHYGMNPNTRPFDHHGIEIQREIVASNPYRHYVFRNRACLQRDSAPAFVFLGGDGNSWIRQGRVSDDPTPGHDVALDLLAAEESCAVYLARPCAYGLASVDPACSPKVWTLDRYSPEVLQSFADLIELLLEPQTPIVWVGYSGGGWIASQLARRVPRTRGLITLGANLDLEAWVAHHDYTRAILERSLPSPFPLHERIHQLHVFGDLDSTCPASLAESVVDPEAMMLLEGVSHACCWADRWPEVREAYQSIVEDRKVSNR